MARIEFEIDDEVAAKLNGFCDETGLSKEALFSVFAKKVAVEECIPFPIGEKKKKGGAVDIGSCDPVGLFEVLNNCDDSIAAVVISLLPANKAAVLIEKFDTKKQYKIISLIASGISFPKSVEEAVLKSVFTSSVDEPHKPQKDGISLATGILNLFDRHTEKAVIEELEEKEPELAEKVKESMFTFNDIVLLDDRSFQRILRDIDASDMAKALKNVNQEVLDKTFRNMSKRAGEMLKEDMEFMGPVRIKDVEEVQSKIVAMVRRLEDAGEVVIARAGKDLFI